MPTGLGVAFGPFYILRFYILHFTFLEERGARYGERVRLRLQGSDSAVGTSKFFIQYFPFNIPSFLPKANKNGPCYPRMLHISSLFVRFVRGGDGEEWGILPR